MIMNRYEHLTLPIFKTEIERKKQGRGGGYKKSENRQKGFFAKNTIKKADELISSFKRIQSRFAGKIDPGLIYEIQINQSVFVQGFEDLLTSMGIRVLSIAENTPDDHVPAEIKFFPGINIRKSGCHQKAWKIYTRQPKNLPTPPVTIALLNVDKWINDQSRMQQYCLSVMFEHEKAINLYNTIRTNIQTRVRM